MNLRSFRLSLVLAASILAIQAPARAADNTAGSWSTEYKACTDRAILKHAAERRDGRLLPPQEIVTMTEQECADRLPSGGSSSAGILDPEDVQRVKAATHLDLLRRFGPVTTVLAPPISAPRARSEGVAFDEPIQCAAGKTDALLGSPAREGRRYAVAVGMSVAVPSAPSDWKLVQCNSTQVTIAHADPAAHEFMTAMGSFVSLPWSNQQAFEDSVLRVVEKSVVAGQHLRTTVVKSATVDGRPCVDIFRAGNVDSMTAPNGASTGPLMTREHVRACHLRDARGPEAAVVEVFQEISAHDPLGFDAVANPFIDGMQLPPWMH